jgi:arylsulfate sulfotransferase
MRSTFAIWVLACCITVLGCKKDGDDSVGKIEALSNPTEGQIVLSPYAYPYTNPGKLLVLNKNGSKIFEKTTPVAAISFKKWVVNGKVRYTYLEFDKTAPQITTTGSIIPCVGVVLNETFQEIKRVRLLPYNGRTTSDPSAIDSHEFIYLDDNHFITLSYFQKPVSNIPASLNPVPNCKVVAPIIQEVLNDAVVFEWDGTNYPEFYRQSLESNAFSNANVVHDYIHMNSIFIDPTDNNLICSLRHTDQVIKISRTDGHIIWRLGGTNSNFPLTADMTFIRQHNATLTDDNKTLLLFDNGDTAIRRTTRIMEFRFNTEQSAITTYKAYNLPQNIFAQYMGSVQKRGNTYFIGCGSTPKILEVNYQTNQVIFLMDVKKGCYRVFKD